MPEEAPVTSQNQIFNEIREFREHANKKGKDDHGRSSHEGSNRPTIIMNRPSVPISGFNSTPNMLRTREAFKRRDLFTPGSPNSSISKERQSF